MIVVSFILENIFTNYNTLFIPTFTLISIFLLKEKSKFFIISFIIGIIYGLIISKFFLLEGINFLLCSYSIYYLNKQLPLSYFSHILISILIIIQYRIFGFTILCLSKVIEFNLNNLLVSIYSSLILNILYTSLLYLFICL